MPYPYLMTGMEKGVEGIVVNTTLLFSPFNSSFAIELLWNNPKNAFRCAFPLVLPSSLQHTVLPSGYTTAIMGQFRALIKTHVFALIALSYLS